MSGGLSRRARGLLAGYGLSSVGTGLIYPFTSIYLHQIRHLSTVSTGADLGIVAVASIAATALAARFPDRVRRTMVLGLCLQAAGYCLVALAGQPVLLALACAVVGIGNGVYFPGVVPAVAALTGDEQRRRAFSLRYLATNAGMGVGAALGGVLASSGSVRGYQALYFGDAASCLAYVCVLFAVLPGRPRTALSPRAGPAARAGITAALRASRPLRWLIACQFCAILFGYSQFDSAIPLLVRTRLGGSTELVGLVISANTVIVIAGQLAVTRLVRRIPTVRVLGGAGLAWSAGYVLLALAGLAGGGSRLVALFAFAAVFAFAECLFGASSQTLLTELADERDLGTMSAVASTAWGTGTAVGPPLGVWMVGAGLPLAPILCLGSLAGTLCARQGSRLAGGAPQAVPARSGSTV